MSTQSGTSRFFLVFEAALRDYEKRTGKSLAKHPLAERLEHCDSAQSVSDILQEQEQVRISSQSSGSGTRIMNLLNSAVSVLYALSTNVALRNAIGGPFPAAKPIFIAFAVLLSAVKDVSSGRDTLMDLLSSIQPCLARLEIYVTIPLTEAMVGALVNIMVELLHILAMVTKQVKDNRLIRFLKKLFGIGKNDIRMALQRLERLTREEALATAAQTLKSVGNLVQDVNEVKDDGKSSGKIIHQIASDMKKSYREKLQQDIRSWLSPPDPWKNHNIARESWHTGTTNWFLRGDTFSEWKSSGPSSLLWIHGKPGAGKSVLCSAIIEDINTMHKSQLASLAFFYCDFREDEKRGLRGLLSSILVQLCHQSDAYSAILSKFYSEHGKGSQYPSDAALKHPPAYLIVDALDECTSTSARPSPREKVLMFMKELIALQLASLRICVTSRSEVDIKAVLDPLAFRSVSLHNERGQIEDINDYIKSVIITDPMNQRWKAEDKQGVIDVLTKKADGMFRWVYCQEVYLRGCLPGRLRNALAELPETLDETYERTLQEIKNAHWEFAHCLLQCVAVASRPLRVEELAEFLALDFETVPVPTFREDWRLEDPVDAVMSTCPSLLAVVNVNDSPVIQFSHFSVKEFLTSSRLAEAKNNISRRFHVSIPHAHTLAAQACLGILLHLPETVIKDSLSKFPLAEYAAEHWVDHARFENVSQAVEDGMKRLFDPSKSHLAVWVWIHNPEEPRTEQADIPPLSPEGTALHYAAFLGLHDIVEFLVIEHSLDVHSRGFSDDSTPLHGASFKGHVEVVRFLLKHGADLAAQANTGQTPLHRASYGGHVELAQVLLEHGALVATQAGDGRTPLHSASSGGHVELVRVLLQHGADSTTEDEDGRIPLYEAAMGGYLELAQVLLGHDTGATAQDKNGESPLHMASSSGHVELARVLLEHGATVTAQDKDGRFPFSYSTSTRVQWIHAIRTEGARENSGWSPLHVASLKGNIRLARVLIDHGADATVQDKDGLTPLHVASSQGYAKLALVLLEHGASATAQDKRGQSPLHWASTWNHVRVAQVLLEHGATVTAQSENGQTPLHRASYKGHVKLVRLLLAHGASATDQDNNGQNPLQVASSQGHIEVSRVLEAGAGVAAQDGNEVTPLHFTSSQGHAEVADVLLEQGAGTSAPANIRQTQQHVVCLRDPSMFNGSLWQARV